MTRTTLVLLLATLAVTLYDPASPSQSLTAGRTPPNASTRPLDAILAYSGAVGGDGSLSTGTGGPSPVGPGLTSVVVGGSGNQSGGAEEVIPVAPSVPSATSLDIADYARATPLVGFGGLHPIAESWSRGVASGIASWMGEGYGPNYLALPIGPGFRVRLCGAAGCVVMVSNDAGPDLAMQRRGRVADVAVVVWERITGLSWRFGLAQVSVSVMGRVR